MDSRITNLISSRRLEPKAEDQDDLRRNTHGPMKLPSCLVMETFEADEIRNHEVLVITRYALSHGIWRRFK